MASANSGTVTPLTSANSLAQQIDNGAPASVSEPTTEGSLNGSTTYANNAAAKAAGLPAGALYLVTTTYVIAMVQ